MDNIRDVKISKCENSIYVRPYRLHFVQDGNNRDWDLLKVHDSVSVLLFNTSRQVLVFVKQFRPAVYFSEVECRNDSCYIDTKKYPGSLGITIELCAGIVDKDASLAEIAKEEALEECGYDIPLSMIRKVTAYRSGVGHSASLQTLFYAEVTDDMKVSKGGGNYDEGEYIEVVEFTLPEAKALIFDERIARPGSMLFGLMWFFHEREHVK